MLPNILPSKTIVRCFNNRVTDDLGRQEQKDVGSPIEMVGLTTGIMPNFSLQTGRLEATAELKRWKKRWRHCEMAPSPPSLEGVLI